jgi:hypothetical protein
METDMGIFDDAAEDAAEPRQVAQSIYDDVKDFINTTLRQNIVVDLADTQIILRTSGGQTLLIVIDGPSAFRLKDDLGNKLGDVQTQVTGATARWSLSGRPFPKHEMVANVKSWLRGQR